MKWGEIGMVRVGTGEWGGKGVYRVRGKGLGTEEWGTEREWIGLGSGEDWRVVRERGGWGLGEGEGVNGVRGWGVGNGGGSEGGGKGVDWEQGRAVYLHHRKS